MLHLFQFSFFLLCFLYHPLLTFSLLPFQNSSSHLCHYDEMIALLHFRSEFTINPDIYENYNSNPKTEGWKENVDCCFWDGVTCDSILGHVIGLNLSQTQLDGRIHPNSSLFQLPHLQSLNLAFNNFNLFPISPNFGHFSNLKVLNLSYSNFSGDVPVELGLLSGMVSLDLSSFEYLLKMPHFQRIMNNLTNLEQLHLSSVSINSTIPQTLANLSSLTSLDLFYCSLKGVFPPNIFKLRHMRSVIVGENPNLNVDPSQFNNFSTSLEVLGFGHTNMSGRLPEYSLGNQPSLLLREIELWNCSLSGHIPMWIWNTTEKISLGWNQFTGVLPLTFNTKALSQLTYIDLSNNLIEGPIPSFFFTLPLLKSLFLEMNHFTGQLGGAFPKENNSLEYLDISNNQLSGKLPNCLGKLSHSLKFLDLGSNFFHGVFPMTFRKDCTLISLHLDNNGFQGKVPLSVMRCKSLQVLNLGNNQLNGSFPSWLDTLPELQVLVLELNNFQGSIEDHLERSKNPFPKLKILDISKNRFSGRLPERYFENFKALMINNGGRTGVTKKRLEYIKETYGYYRESLKGMSHTYIITIILSGLDFSNNLFTGEIPDSISWLEALKFLNVSNNHLTGHIPQSIANLNFLESLDLSCNMLQGNIPPELGLLVFLEIFNVSENQLVGLVPVGPQFNTFSRDSYDGNPGLCGVPLPKCVDFNHRRGKPKSKYDFVDIVTSVSLWEIILIGFGFGTLFGFITVSYMLFTVRPVSFSKKVDRLQYNMMQTFKKQTRMWQRRI